MLQHVLCLQAALVETMRRGATTTTYVLYVSYNYCLLQLELEDPSVSQFLHNPGGSPGFAVADV